MKQQKIISLIVQGLQIFLEPSVRILPKEMLTSRVNKILAKRSEYLEACDKNKTPFYLYDDAALLTRIEALKETFGKHFHKSRIFFAMKSNSYGSVCERALKQGLGLDVSSGLELRRALKMGAEQIVFSGPGKTDDELLLAIKNRSRVVTLIDSLGEYKRIVGLLKQHPELGGRLIAGIRVSDGKQWSKFGIPLSELPGLLFHAEDEGRVHFRGIQFHTSWNLEPSSQLKMVHRIGTCLRRHLPSQIKTKLIFIDIGGGFWPEQGEWLNESNIKAGAMLRALMPNIRLGHRHYVRKGKALSYFLEKISSAILAEGKPLSAMEVWAEPGRWICDPCMHILLRVLDKKAEDMVITDGGTNLLGWERPLFEYLPIINLTRPSVQEKRTYIYGPLCTPMDIWGTSFFGSGIEKGDILIVPNQGAYTYSLRQRFIKGPAKVVSMQRA